MRKDDKIPLYPTCPVSKLEADIMLLEFKSTHRLNDKGFDDFLGIVRKLLKKTSWQKKTYLTKQMICPMVSRLKKSMHALMIAYCTVETNTKT
jgi:hypothetical protein